MTTITFTAAQVEAMDKKACKSMLRDLNAMLDDATKALLTARIEQLERPAEPTPFPRQSELTDAWQQWQQWGETVKELVTDARKGFHSYVLDPKEGTVTPKRHQRKDGTGGTTRGKAEDLQITVNGVDYDSWTAVCDALVPTLVEDKAAKGTEKRSIGWRAEAYKAAKKTEATVVLTFKSAEKFKTYQDNQDDGLGWLPEWITVVKDF